MSKIHTTSFLKDQQFTIQQLVKHDQQEFEQSHQDCSEEKLFQRNKELDITMAKVFTHKILNSQEIKYLEDLINQQKTIIEKTYPKKSRERIGEINQYNGILDVLKEHSKENKKTKKQKGGR